MLAEGVLLPAERMLVTDFRRAKGIGADMHERALRRIGWSNEEWAAGMQRGPAMLRGAAGGAEPAGGTRDDGGGFPAGYKEFVRRGKQDLHMADAEATTAEGGIAVMQRRTSTHLGETGGAGAPRPAPTSVLASPSAAWPAAASERRQAG